MDLMTVFTILRFLSSLRKGTISLNVHYARLERLVSNKHFSLLGQFVSYEENHMPQELFSQYFIFLVT